MTYFQAIFLVLLTVLVAAAAQEGCDAICDERVQQAVQPINDEKVRAEEWGHGVRRDLEQTNERLRSAEEVAQQLRVAIELRDGWVADRDTWIRERDQIISNLRGEIEKVKQESVAEIDELRTKAEESSRSLGRVQFALDEATDQIKEMETARISVNLKGIQEDVRLYWKNLLGWWTGLVMPEKKKEEDL